MNILQKKKKNSPKELKLAEIEYFEVSTIVNLIFRKFSFFGCAVKFGL